MFGSNRRRRPEPAPQLRAGAVALAAGRLAIGAGLMVAPVRTLAALGFTDPSSVTVAVARVAGIRDLALGALGVLALDDREHLRTATLACAAADAGDAVTFAAAAVSADPSVRTAGLRGVAAAGPAALAGAWLASRLR